jgi:hypothetical protein
MLIAGKHHSVCPAESGVDQRTGRGIITGPTPGSSRLWRTDRIPFAPLRVGKCWNADSRNEIDVVAIGGDGALLLRECMWGMVRPGDLKRLQARPI